MKIAYCVECASSLAAQDSTVYECPNGHYFYNNPNTAVCVVLHNQKGDVLFAKRGRQPQQNKYDFPGGFVNYGEDVYDALRRELREEAGIELTEPKLVTCASNIYLENVSTTDLLFVASEWQGEPVANDDVAALEWHPLEFMLSEHFAWPEAYGDKYETIKLALGVQ